MFIVLASHHARALLATVHHGPKSEFDTGTHISPGVYGPRMHHSHGNAVQNPDNRRLDLRRRGAATPSPLKWPLLPTADRHAEPSGPPVGLRGPVHPAFGQASHARPSRLQESHCRERHPLPPHHLRRRAFPSFDHFVFSGAVHVFQCVAGSAEWSIEIVSLGKRFSYVKAPPNGLDPRLSALPLARKIQDSGNPRLRRHRENSQALPSV